MSRVYVGNLDPRTSERELEDEFREYGILRSVWVARKPPGYAFVEFDDRRDAADAIRSLDGKHGWRVEMSRSSGGGGVSRRRGGDDMNCYECGEPGHFARECRLRIGAAGFGSGTRRVSRSPPPRYRRSPSYGYRYSPPPRRYYSPRRNSNSPPRYRSISPPSRYRNSSSSRYRSISPVHRYRSISPAAHRARSPSRSPPMMRRGRGSIYENGSPYSRTRYRSFSGSP